MTIETRFRVEGMDCASCATKIDTAVRRVEGVEDVSVSVTTGTMTVRHSATDGLAETVAKKVGGLGYKTAPAPKAAATTMPPVACRWRISALAAGMTAKATRSISITPRPVCSTQTVWMSWAPAR